MGIIVFISLLLCAACSGEDAMSSAGEVDEGSAYTVGVYYYPWYGGDFHGGRYMRDRLVPPQYPELGEYDDRDTAVIAQHLAWSRQAHIDLWVASWWGPGKREDQTLLEQILPHGDLGSMQIALFYETSGRTRNFEYFSNVGADIAYMAEHYFDHSNYLRIDGKPVLFVYLTRVLSRKGTLGEMVAIMRAAAKEAGHEIYIVGDEVFGQPPASSDGIALLDAVTNYDVYGSMGAKGYAGQATVDRYYAVQSRWREKAHAEGVAFVPTATPGFNDKGVRGGHAAVSRKLDEGAEFGSLFRAMLEQAVDYTDESTGKMLLITSWNEWHEDTQIEPVEEAVPTKKDASGTGEDFSEGLEYEGYGERYLQVLREVVER
jgi:glycoprotein endo-alpha-1,2-mannosidase